MMKFIENRAVSLFAEFSLPNRGTGLVLLPRNIGCGGCPPPYIVLMKISKFLKINNFRIRQFEYFLRESECHQTSAERTRWVDPHQELHCVSVQVGKHRFTRRGAEWPPLHNFGFPNMIFPGNYGKRMASRDASASARKWTVLGEVRM